MPDMVPDEELNEPVSPWIVGFDGQVIISITADGFLIYPRLKNGVLDNQYMRHTDDADLIGLKVNEVYKHMIGKKTKEVSEF